LDKRAIVEVVTNPEILEASLVRIVDVGPNLNRHSSVSYRTIICPSTYLKFISECANIRHYNEQKQ